MLMRNRDAFNEAPALRGGNHAEIVEGVFSEDDPSMRPPHCAGEILFDHSPTRHGPAPSMRPPHCAGEIIAEFAAGKEAGAALQ